MANRIQPHPNPPYLKSDGTLNVSGQLKLYAAGTSTAKIAYSDAAGTSYGSTIDLNSSGLPDSGPIYWDTTALYKVEVYTRTDDAPTYALDYTVDNFGNITSSELNTITTATTWTVDGVGATDTTFVSLTEAMVAARNYIIMLDSGLTINVDNGTYTDEIINFSHPQGRYIVITGESEAGCIFQTSASSIHVFNIANTHIGKINRMTLKQPNASFACMAVNNSHVNAVEEVTLDCDGTGLDGLSISSDSFMETTTLTIKDFVGSGISLSGASNLLCNDALYINNSATAAGLNGILASGRGTSVELGSATTIDIDGNSGTRLGAGVKAQVGASIILGDPLTVDYCTTAIAVATHGQIILQDATPAYANNTANYSPTTVDQWSNIATNTDMGFIAT